MFPIGCCISFSGIYVLSKGPEESEDADMERMVDEDEKPAGSPALSSGTSDSSPITSGGSQRERYRSRMSTCAAGPLLGFLNSSTIVDRDNISETIKMRRRSTVRGTSLIKLKINIHDNTLLTYHQYPHKTKLSTHPIQRFY